MSDSWYYIKIRKSRGRHTDVYVDFESAFAKQMNWKPIPAANHFSQAFFNAFFLNLFKKRAFDLRNIPLKTSKNLFTIISGTQYSKLWHWYIRKGNNKAIYMFDPWPTLNTLNTNAIKTFGINIAIFPSKQAVSFFNSQKLNNFEAYYVPEGIDSNKYTYKDYQFKTIDIIQYGRHWNWLHKELIQQSEIKNLSYEYDRDLGQKGLQYKTRKEFTEALSRSKIAVCVPRNITHSHLVNDLSTLTTRYFECMSSKCIIWGSAPQELIDLMGYNPVIEIDLKNPIQQLKEILINYSSYKDLIEKNYEAVIKDHQWSDRAERIINILNCTL